MKPLRAPHSFSDALVCRHITSALKGLRKETHPVSRYRIKLLTADVGEKAILRWKTFGQRSFMFFLV
jgi:hypothetical protein